MEELKKWCQKNGVGYEKTADYYELAVGIEKLKNRRQILKKIEKDLNIKVELSKAYTSKISKIRYYYLKIK